MRKRAAFVVSLCCAAGCGGRSVSRLPGFGAEASAGRSGADTSGGGRAGSSATSAGDAGRGGASAWETLSHTPPPPPSNDVTWQAAPPAYGAVWSDSAERAWVTSSVGNYKAPPTFELLRWEAGEFSAEDTACKHTIGAIAALSVSDMWLAACDGGVGHRAGTTWSWVGGSPQDQHIWESSPSDVWTCCSPFGNDGTDASNWNGSAWSVVTLPSGGHHDGAVWSRSPSDVWIADSGDSTLFHRDGTTWVTPSVPDAGPWRGIWGDGENIWLVAAGGVVVRGASGGLDGWEMMPTGSVLASPVTLNAVWGSSPTDVWIAGDAGTILHWDGTSFRREEAGVTATLAAVWGAPGVVWIAGLEATLLRRAN